MLYVLNIHFRKGKHIGWIFKGDEKKKVTNATEVIRAGYLTPFGFFKSSC